MIVGGFFTPTTPVLVPEVGRGRELQAVRTVSALRRAGRLLRQLAPDALVVVVQGHRAGPALRMPASGALRRRFDDLDAPELSRADPFDRALTEALRDLIGDAAVTCSDQWPQEALAALYFLVGGLSLPCACLQLPSGDLALAADTGRAIADAAERRGGRTAVIAAGELSSRLFPGAPGGYHDGAASFDAGVLAALRERSVAHLTELPAPGSDAGESALVQLVALLTVTPDSMPISLLSYEYPFGVGYAVAAVTPALQPGATLETGQR